MKHVTKPYFSTSVHIKNDETNYHIPRTTKMFLFFDLLP